MLRYKISNLKSWRNNSVPSSFCAIWDRTRKITVILQLFFTIILVDLTIKSDLHIIWWYFRYFLDDFAQTSKAYEEGTYERHC